MDRQRLALYRRLAPVEWISQGGAALMAAAHPGLAPAGSLSAPVGDPGGFSAVIVAGEAWLRGRGCTRVLAPMEQCTWFPYRARLGPFDYPELPLEPRADPQPWQQAGYAELARYDSTRVQHELQLARFAAAEARVAEAGIRLRPLRLRQWERELRRAWEICQTAFARAYAFVPLPWEAFLALYAPLKPLMEPRLVVMAEDSEGQVAGFLMSLPGPDAPGGATALAKTLAVHPRAQGMGLAQALLAHSHHRALELGLPGGLIHALIHRDNASQHLGSAAAQLLREYALYGRELAPERPA